MTSSSFPFIAAYIQHTESKCCLFIHVFRIDHLRLNNMSGSLSLEKTQSLSQQPLIFCSFSSTGEILWNLLCPRWHVKRSCHYGGLCKATILLRLHGSCFPLMFIIHHHTIDVPVLWLLESSCPLSLIPNHSLSLVSYRMFSFLFF